MYCHTTFNKQWMGLDMLSQLFHYVVDVAFHLLSVLSQKAMDFYCRGVVTAYMLSLLSLKNQ